MANNIMSYMSNVGKSIVYSSIDNIKKTSPALAELAEQNAELSKEVYQSVKDYKTSIKKASDFIVKSDVGQAVAETKKSIFEDLKTGQFYNRKRIDEMEIKASGGLLDFNMDDDPFNSMDSDDFDNNDGWNDWDPSNDDIFMAEALDETGSKIVAGVAGATIRSADYIVKANKDNTRQMQLHSEFLANKIGVHIGAVNSSIAQLVDFNNNVVGVHVENSKKFYDFATNNMTKQTELLEKLVANTNLNQYNVNKSKSSSIKYDDIVGSEGTVDIKQYFKMISQNINDLSGGIMDMNKAIGGGNMLMMMAGSPLKVITDTIAKKIIPGVVSTSLESLNTTISSAFSSAMMKSEYISNNSDNELFKMLAKVLGTNTDLKTSVDVSKYNRGAIQFDGETKMAILNISDQMGKLISAVSGKPEKIFDYNTGKWTDLKTFSDNNSTDKKIRKSSQSSSYEFRNTLEDLMKNTDFGSAELKKQIKESIDNMMVNAFQSGGLFGFDDPSEFARRMGIDYESARYIIPALQHLSKNSKGRNKLMSLNNDIYRGRLSHNNSMRNSETNVADINRLLHNDYGVDEFINRNSKGDKLNNPYDVNQKTNKSPLLSTNNLITVRDNKGKNVFDYLQKTVWELEYIRLNGLGSGRVNTSSGNIILPSDFIDTNNIMKTNNQAMYSERQKNESQYLRERESLYRKEMERNEKGNYLKPVFNSIAEMNGLDDDEMMARYGSYLDEQYEYGKVAKHMNDSKEKRIKKNNRPSWVKAMMDMDSVDDRVKTFMDGMFTMSNKPAEFVARTIERTDLAIFNAIYGDPNSDHMSQTSVMQNLIARMTTTFANFGDFLKDDILNPIKAELFGDSGIFGDVKNALKDRVRGFSRDASMSARDYLLGTYTTDETTGQRVRLTSGMFGGKLDYITKNMKDVYRTPVSYLKGGVTDSNRNGYEDSIRAMREINAENRRDDIAGERRAARSAFRFISDDQFNDGNIDPSLIVPREQALRDAMEDGISNYYSGGYVKKTGIAAVSEGEMIIPSEMNPFYNKATNKAQQRMKENSAKRDFVSYINGIDSNKRIDAKSIPGFSDGTAVVRNIDFGNGRAREAQTRSSRKSTPSRDDAAAASGDYEYQTRGQFDIRSEYNEGQESIGYKIGDEVRNLFGFMSALGLNKENIQKRLNNASERFATSAEKVAEQMSQAVGTSTEESQELFYNMVTDVKGGFSKYMPSLLGGGLIGGGISLVTGAVGGPLLGAAIGAATDLTINSGAVQNWLFGEIGNDGKRRGNVLSKELSNNINKYLPDMAKGGIVGGITSILPFVPGGPVAGIILGSSLGFAKNNDKMQKFLFGDEDTNGILPKDFITKFKGMLPAGILGGTIGALTGPFGLVGNIAVGSAIGIATKTDTFKNALFGTVNEDGEHEGGMLNTIKEGFVNPVIDFGLTFGERINKWFKDDIANPIVNAIAPITKQGKLFVGKLVSAITGKMENMMEEQFKMPFGQWFGEKVMKPTGRFVGGTLNTLAHPVGRIVSSPFRMIGGIGEHYRGKHVASGNASYMTALQRNQYREEVSNGVTYKRYTKDERDESGNLIHRKGEFVIGENGEPVVDRRRGNRLFNDLSTGRRNRRDNFREFDNMLVNTDIDSLKSMRDSLNFLSNPNQFASGQKNTSIRNIKNILKGKVSYNTERAILEQLNQNNFDGAMEIVRRSGLEPNELRRVTQALTQEFSSFQSAGQMLNNEASSRNKVFSQLRRLGFKDINDNNIDKYRSLLNQEIENKPDEKSEIEKLNENQNTRHTEIVDLFKSVVDELRAIRDPRYAEQLASERFQHNMVSAQRQRGLFRFMDNGNSGVFGNYTYKAEMGQDGLLHYYRIKPNGDRQEIDQQGRPLSQDGRFTEDYDETELAYNNGSTQNTNSYNTYMASRGFITRNIHRAGEAINSFGTRVGSGMNRAWNGASYTERAQRRSDSYELEQDRWMRKLRNAGIAIPDGYSGSYKELWKRHFYGRQNLRRETESDDVKYVNDQNGMPIKWIRNQDGQWEVDESDSETRTYLSAGDRATALLQQTADGISSVGSTLKDGFLNLFNIDEERDGVLKTIAKIGGGVLGALTIAGFGPILENWFDNTAKPWMSEMWTDKIGPKLGEWLEPIKPTIARAAAGVDSTIRSIPVAIDNLGDKVKNFFAYQFPDLMANKIIPFYKNGIDWLGEKVGTITEVATRTLLNIAPKILYGAIKGSWQFMKNDIFTLFGGYGRRDAASLMNSTTSVSSSNTGSSKVNKKQSSLNNFSFFSNAYSGMMGESPEQTLGITPSASQLESYYSGKSNTLPEVKMVSIDNKSYGSSNNSQMSFSSPKTSSFNIASPDDYQNYAESFGSGYGVNSLDSRVVSEYNNSIATGSKSSNTNYTSGIANWNNASFTQNGVVPNNEQFVVDSATQDVYDMSGEKVGYKYGNSIFTSDGRVYDNSSVAAILDSNNESIASKGIKASIRAFATGSGSALTKGISNFGKSSRLINSNIVTRTVRRSINSVGSTIEGAGRLGNSARNGITSRLVTGSSDDLLKALSASSAKEAVGKQYTRLVQEALSSGFSADDAAEWARMSIKDNSSDIYNSIYKSVDDIAAAGARRSTSAGIEATKSALRSSADDMIEGIARSSSQEIAERTIAGVALNAGSSDSFLKKFTVKVTGFFDNIYKNATIRKYLAKSLAASGKSSTDEAIEIAMKTLTKQAAKELTEEFGGSIVKLGAKGIKALGEILPYINIVFLLVDFYDGFNNGPTMLGMLKDDCPMWMRLVTGLAQLINGKLTLGLLPLSVLVELFVNIIAPMFAIDIQSFEDLRYSAGLELDAFNKKNSTNLNLKEYNNRNNYVSRAYERIKSVFTGKYIYDGIQEVDGNAKSGYSVSARNIGANVNAYDNSFSMAYAGDGSGLKSAYNTGGNHITQIDSNYANIRFNSPKDSVYQTIGDSACGPASAAMVVNSINNTNNNIKDAARFALTTDTKVQNGGVRANYFNEYYAANGLQAQYTDNVSGIKNLLTGTKNPVVLLGQDTKNTSKTYSPFGPNNHYVVANKISPDGKTVYINDPEQSKSNIPYSANILDRTILGIGATKGNKGLIPVKYNNMSGTGGNSPRIGLSRNNNRTQSLSKYIKHGNKLSGRGTTADTLTELGIDYNITVEEGRSTLLINEIISSIMVLQSSLNLSSVNYSVNKEGSVAIGIMQWYNKDASILLNKIYNKNTKGTTSVLGESSYLLNCAKNKNIIVGKSLTPTARTNLSTLLSSTESREIQISEAKNKAIELINKCRFTNVRAIMFWSAIYNYNPSIANELSTKIGRELDVDSSVTGLYTSIQSIPEATQIMDKIATLFAFIQSSPCMEVDRSSFDTSLLSQIIKSIDNPSGAENNFLTQIFSKITELGKLYFGISSSTKSAADNLDGSLGDIYTTAEIFNIDPTTMVKLDSYIPKLDDVNSTLAQRLEVLRTMFNIDKYSTLMVFENNTSLFHLLNEFICFDKYLTYNSADSTSINSRISFLTSTTLLSDIKKECLDKLNKYDFSNAEDLQGSDSIENSIIYDLFRTQILYFEVCGSESDFKGIKYDSTISKNTGISFNRAITKGSGSCDNNFFNQRMVYNKALINILTAMNNRKSIIEYLYKYLGSTGNSNFETDLNNCKFFGNKELTNYELSLALSILDNKDYSLEVKEEAWNSADAIINSGFINNPSANINQLKNIINKYPNVKDFNHYLSGNTNSNTGTNAISSVFNKNNKQSVINTSSIKQFVSNKSITPAIGNIGFQSSLLGLNPYTAKIISRAKSLEELSKRNISSTGSINVATSFENMAKMRWLYKTDQGLSSSNITNNIIGKISHPTGARIATDEYNKYRDMIAEQIAIVGDDPAISRRKHNGSLITAMIHNYNKTDLLNNWLSYYSLWKSTPSMIGGPFKNGYNFNRDEWVTARTSANADMGNEDKENSAQLQELIANEILGDTRAVYNADNAPLSKYNHLIGSSLNKALNNTTDNTAIYASKLKSEDKQVYNSGLTDIGDNIINAKNNAFNINTALSVAPSVLDMNKLSSTINNPDDKPAKGSGFVSQYDYGNKRFRDGDSLSRSGCGPAVASMVLNSAGSTTPVMDYAASVANNYKDDGGTKASYFGDILGRAGMNTDYIGSNVKSGIKSSLSAGQQVVVMGQDGSNNSKNNSPFGPGNHYVLATGMGKGSVMINDPEQSGPRLYSDKILNSASLGIAVSGKGTRLSNKFRRISAGDSKIGDNALAALIATIGQEESSGNYGCVVRNDNNGLSIGLSQSHYINAYNLLRAIFNKLGANKSREVFKQHGCESFYNKITTASTVWNKTTNPPINVANSAQEAAIKAILTTPEGKSVQLTMMNDDLFTKLKNVVSLGVSAKVAVLLCHWLHMHGNLNNIKKNMSSSDTVNTALSKMTSSSSTNESRKKRYTRVAEVLNGLPELVVPASGFSATEVAELLNIKSSDIKNIGSISIDNSSIINSGDVTTSNNRSGSWLDDIVNGIDRLGKAYFGIKSTNSMNSSTFSSDSFNVGLSSTGNSIVDTASTYIGKVPYKYGGTDIDGGTGADCSGFTQQIYSKLGISIPRVAHDQFKDSNGKFIDKSALQSGDLVFFSWGNNGHADHVGIFTGNNSYIHSPQTGEYVKESKFNQYALEHSLGGRRYNVSATGSNITNKINSILSGRGTTNSKQKLVSTLSSMKTNPTISKSSHTIKRNIVDPTINNNMMNKLNRRITDVTTSARGNSAPQKSSMDSGIIYEALNTIVNLLGQTVVNTSYNSKLTELVDLVDTYVVSSSDSAKGTSTSSKSSNSKISSKVSHVDNTSNIMAGTHSQSDIAKLQQTINRMKKLISN